MPAVNHLKDHLTRLIAAFALVLATFVVAATHASRGAGRVCESGRVREHAARGSAERLAGHRRGRLDDPGLRHVDERERRPDRVLQDQHPGDARTTSTSCGSATTRGNGARKVVRRTSSRRPRSRRPSRRARTTRTATGPHRLRQLGGVGVVDRADHRGVRRLHRAPGPRRHQAGGDSQIPFVVRNDASHSDIARPDLRRDLAGLQHLRRQQPLHVHGQLPAREPDGYKGASKVSYNRPVRTPRSTTDGGAVWLMYAEYQMIRFLEENGYDVSYTSGLDVGTTPVAACSNHKIFMSTGHDEYWSGHAARQRRGRPRRRGQPGVLQRQRGVLEDPLGAEHRRHRTRPTGRWSPTRRRTSTLRSTRRTRPPGRARGWIRGSARRRTADGRRTR